MTDAFGAGGGIAQYNRDLISALSESSDVGSIDVLPRLCPRGPGPLPEKARQFRAIKDQLIYSVKALQVACARRPDVVFCGHLYMAPLAALVAWLFRAKLLIQTHGVEIWPRPPILQRAAFELADLVLCVSRDTRARVLNWAAMAPERVAVLPNTVSEIYQPGDGTALREAWGLGGKTVLLSISRLDAGQRYKGQDRVIRLIKRLRARGHDVVFLIGGVGDDRPRLEALAAEEGVEEHVRFLGGVSDKDLPALYRAADLYLMPSAGEGFGIVFLEAMASGTPAMGLAVGGATDALVDGDAAPEAELEPRLLARLEAGKGDPRLLSARVRARFGCPVFQERARRLLARLLDDRALAA